MADMLNFREAVQRAGVSRQRLNEAIRSGHLPAQRGGGPGKPTTIRLEDLQAWCVSEGLAMPVEASERLEPSQLPAIADMMSRLDQMFAGMERLERLMGQVLERLERSPDPASFAHELRQLVAEFRAPVAPERDEPPPPARPTTKAVLLDRLRAMQAEGLSLQAMANRLNSEGVPTLSGKGRWQKGTIGKLLVQEEE
jgi:Recombinase